MFPRSLGYAPHTLHRRRQVPPEFRPMPQVRPEPNLPQPKGLNGIWSMSQGELLPPALERLLQRRQNAMAADTGPPRFQTPGDGFVVTPPPTGDQMAVPPPRMPEHPATGAAPDGTPLHPIDLRFARPQEDKLDPKFRAALEGVSDDMGRDLEILSGYRSPFHSVEAAKPGGPGMHSKGLAADINMAGMDDATRQDLIRRLHAAGVRRFGTYSKSPFMLHVDTKDQYGNGAPHFMFDKTITKMGKAPGYFRDVSRSLRGEGPRSELESLEAPVPVTNGAQPRPAPQGLFAGFDKDKLRNSMAGFLQDQARAHQQASQLRRSAVRSPQAHFSTAPAVPWAQPIRR